MTRKVIATFHDRPEAPVYEVEYQDSEGVWMSAVGVWAGGEIKVRSHYGTQAGARSVARALTKVCGWSTRVLESKQGAEL